MLGPSPWELLFVRLLEQWYEKPDIVYLDEQVKSHFHSRAYPQEASFHSEYIALPPQSFSYTYLEKWNKLIGHCKEDMRVISVYEKCLEQHLYVLSTVQVAACTE